MIKKFCDKCGKELSNNIEYHYIITNGNGIFIKELDLCNNCLNNIIKSILKDEINKGENER